LRKVCGLKVRVVEMYVFGGVGFEDGGRFEVLLAGD